MKKILMILVALMAVSAASAQVKYRGFADLSGGGFLPGEGSDNGGSLGVSTTHGFEVAKGFFVGAGFEANALFFRRYNGWLSYYYEDNIDTYVALAGYGAARYTFLEGRRVQPFVNMRLGGGYQSITEKGALYFSPSAGVNINFTKNFGLDVSLAYTLWSTKDWEYYGECAGIIMHGLTTRIGVHF